MADDLVPFEFVRGRTDVSDFRSLTRPSRVMTVREQWVYNQLAIDWAELEGVMQKVLYAEACIGRLAVHLREVFKRAATVVLEDLDATFEEYGRPQAALKRDYLVGSADISMIMRKFDKELLDSTATNMRRLKEAADHELARIAVRSLDPPSEAELAPRVIVRRGFWQRLFYGDADGGAERRSDWQRERL